MNFYDLPFGCPPTCATRIDEDHHAFSIDSCWKRNERQFYRKPAQPWPKPSQPQENTRAIAQLEQCAQIPAAPALHYEGSASGGGRHKAWYLDDQSRVLRIALRIIALSLPLRLRPHHQRPDALG